MVLSPHFLRQLSSTDRTDHSFLLETLSSLDTILSWVLSISLVFPLLSFQISQCWGARFLDFLSVYIHSHKRKQHVSWPEYYLFGGVSQIHSTSSASLWFVFPIPTWYFQVEIYNNTSNSIWPKRNSAFPSPSPTVPPLLFAMSTNTVFHPVLRYKLRGHPWFSLLFTPNIIHKKILSYASSIPIALYALHWQPSPSQPPHFLLQLQ